MEIRQRKRSKDAVLKWMAKDEEAAFKYHVENAWKGDKATMEGIGFPFTEGNGLWWTAKESFKLFKKYAEQGYVIAQWGLACFYLKGKCVKKDINVAAQWFERAAEQGDAESQFQLGTIYLVHPDPENPEDSNAKAAQWFKKAAEQGHMLSQYQLGYLYLIGCGVHQDFKEAFKWYLAAAKQGCVDVMSMLGDWYYLGSIVKENDEEAFYWYKRAEEHGKYSSDYGLDLMYENEDVPPEYYKRELKQYKKEADTNWHACYRLGLMYHFGLGVEQSDEKTLKWYKKTIALHDFPDYSMDVLADKYYYGNGINQSYEEAIKWYKKAANKGWRSSKEKLIELWYEDENAKPDFKTVYKWIKEFAKQGRQEYQCKLGVLFLDGDYLRKNRKKAVLWLKASAKQGYKPAQDKLDELGE